MSAGDKIARRRNELGLSQADLAKRIGVSQAAVNSIESGNTKKSRYLARIAQELQIPLHDLDPDIDPTAPPTPRPPPNVGGQSPLPPPNGRPIPVLGQAVGGIDGRLVFNGEVSDYVMCPPGMETARGAYALYVAGESMVPVFKPGQLVWVHPGLPPRRGDDVVVQLVGDDGEPPEGYVKEFVGWTPAKLLLRQHNPPKDIEFDRADVISVHVITFSQRR